MNLKQSIQTLGLSALLFATGCATSDLDRKIMGSKHEVEKKSHRQDLGYRQSVVPAEVISLYLQNPNGARLRAWNLLDEDGAVVGIYAEGRSYGLHFRELTTDKYMLDGNVQNGPSRAKELGYQVKQIQ